MTTPRGPCSEKGDVFVQPSNSLVLGRAEGANLAESRAMKEGQESRRDGCKKIPYIIKTDGKGRKEAGSELGISQNRRLIGAGFQKKGASQGSRLEQFSHGRGSKKVGRKDPKQMRRKKGKPECP